MKMYKKWIFIAAMLLNFFEANATPFVSPAQQMMNLNSKERIAEVIDFEQHSKEDLKVWELPDQLNIFDKRLANEDSVHYFSFKVVRGQDAVLVTPSHNVAEVSWRVEYFLSGRWQVKNTNQPIVFSDLKPDDFVLVRIFHDKEKVFFGGTYGLAIGSYPVLAQSKLEGPADMARVPLTNIRVMGTQTNGPLIFKALFKDTTGRPLKGGIAKLHLFKTLDSSRVDVAQSVESDETGWASLSFDISRCTSGGFAAKAIKPMPHGYIYTWVTSYNVGGWYAFDSIIGSEDVNDHYVFGLGHVCSQKLVSAVKIRN